MRWPIVAMSVITLASALVAPRPTAVHSEIEAQGVGVAIQSIAPNTTHHTVTLLYKRHGGAGERASQSEINRPEWTRSENWMTFDDSGAVSSNSGSMKGLDGTVYQTWELEGGDLLLRDRFGETVYRSPGFASSHTAESTRSGFEQAIDLASAEIAAHPDASVTTLGSQDVLVVEERDDASELPRAANEGYALPYVQDLNPIEQIRRSYYLAEINFLIKTELVVVGRGGEETVVDRIEYEIFEVLPSQ